MKSNEKLKPIPMRKEAMKSLTPMLNKLTPVSKVVKKYNSSLRRPTMNEEYQRLILGDFTKDFSKQTSKLFRIFLSSTFSDFKVERNELYRRVFPSIKERCSELGYEFQVVDMRFDRH